MRIYDKPHKIKKASPHMYGPFRYPAIVGVTVTFGQCVVGVAVTIDQCVDQCVVREKYFVSDRRGCIRAQL